MFGAEEPELRALSPAMSDWTAAIMSRIDPGKLGEAVRNFPAPRNRLHAPEAMAQADELILQQFRAAGWSAEARAYELENVYGILDYPQAGRRLGTVRKMYKRLAGTNLIAIKEGASSRSAFVIGAHFDTVRDSPGADDNTASVVALLELARLLAPYRFRDTIILAALDMEELNFVGSRALVGELAREREIKGAIIFETMAYTATEPNSQFVPPGLGLLYPQQLGRMKRRQFVGDWTLVIYRASATELARTFGESLAHIGGAESTLLMRDPVDLNVIGGVLKRFVPVVKNFARSDHVSFWEAGIPAIMLTDTANFRNPNYHKPTDLPDTLDYAKLAAITGATAVAAARLAGLVDSVAAE